MQAFQPGTKPMNNGRVRQPFTFTNGDRYVRNAYGKTFRIERCDVRKRLVLTDTFAIESVLQ